MTTTTWSAVHPLPEPSHSGVDGIGHGEVGHRLEPGHLSCLRKEVSLARLVSTVSHQARQVIHSRMGQMVRYKSIVGPSGQLGRLPVARDGAAKSLSLDRQSPTNSSDHRIVPGPRGRKKSSGEAASHPVGGLVAEYQQCA